MLFSLATTSSSRLVVGARGSDLDILHLVSLSLITVLGHSLALRTYVPAWPHRRCLSIGSSNHHSIPATTSKGELRKKKKKVGGKSLSPPSPRYYIPRCMTRLSQTFPLEGTIRGVRYSGCRGPMPSFQTRPHSVLLLGRIVVLAMAWFLHTYYGKASSSRRLIGRGCRAFCWKRKQFSTCAPCHRSQEL